VSAGYVCKRCGGAAPVGVGYVSTAPGAAARSAMVDACPCGYSVAPEPVEPPTLGESLADADWARLEAAGATLRGPRWPMLRERYNVRQDGAVVRSWAGVLPGEAVPFDGHVVIDARGVEVIPR